MNKNIMSMKTKMDGKKQNIKGDSKESKIIEKILRHEKELYEKWQEVMIKNIYRDRKYGNKNKTIIYYDKKNDIITTTYVDSFQFQIIKKDQKRKNKRYYILYTDLTPIDRYIKDRYYYIYNVMEEVVKHSFTDYYGPKLFYGRNGAFSKIIRNIKKSLKN